MVSEERVVRRKMVWLRKVVIEVVSVGKDQGIKEYIYFGSYKDLLSHICHHIAI